MADLGEAFDAEATEPTNFDLLPAGDYEAMIVESEKRTSNGGDDYISLTFQILGPTHAGRKHWHNLNLWHKTSTEAVQISRGNLSAICRAVGILHPKDTSELHNLPMIVRIGQKARKDNGEMQNVMTNWKPKGGTTAKQEETRKLETAGASPAKPAAAPWAKVK
jgi:hypothetical protein